MHFFLEEVSCPYTLFSFLLSVFFLLWMRLSYIRDSKLLSLVYVRIFFHGVGLRSSVCANLDVGGRVSSSS